MIVLVWNCGPATFKFPIIDTDHGRVVGGTRCAISTPASTLTAYVAPTNEELLIARNTIRTASPVAP
jgi:acetate kinase